MAPTTTVNHLIDWRVQIIENCRFTSRAGAYVTVITTKEPLGTFKAVVVRIQDAKRQPLFSASAVTIPEALKALHDRSAEAVQTHIDSIGWDFVPVPKKHGWTRKTSDKDQGDSEVESSYSQSASSTVTVSDVSDDELVSVGGRPSRAGKKKVSKSSRKGKGMMGRSRSRSRSQSRSPSRSRSPRRNRSSSVGTVTSSSGDEDSPRPTLFFRPNRMRAPNYPPGWEKGFAHDLTPTGLNMMPSPNMMRGQPPPPPPPPPPQLRPFPGVAPMPNPGQPLPSTQSLMPLLHTAQQHRPPAANEPQRLQPGNQMKMNPPAYNTQRPNQPYPFIPLPARRPESTQSNGSDGSNTNKPTPTTGGYNPFTTVFSTPTPPQSPTTTHDVLLHLRWRDPINLSQIHEQRLLEHIPRLSVSAVKKAAITYVQRQKVDYTHKNGIRPPKFILHPPWTASLKRLSLQNGLTCVISHSISDDASLLRLIQAIDSTHSPDKIPVVEVDVYDRSRGPLDGTSTENTDNTSTPAPYFPPATAARLNPPPPPIPPGWEKPSMNTRRKIEVTANTPMNPQRQPHQPQQQPRPATTRPDFTFMPPPQPQYQLWHHQGAVRPPMTQGQGQGPPQGAFIMPGNGNGTTTGNPNGTIRPGPIQSPMTTTMAWGMAPENPLPTLIKVPVSPSSSSSSSLASRKKGEVGVGGAGDVTPATSTSTSGNGDQFMVGHGIGAGDSQMGDVGEGMGLDCEDGDGDGYFESDA